MYRIKITKHVDKQGVCSDKYQNETIVPRKNWLYEGCCVEYEKVKLTNVEVREAEAKNLSRYEVFFIGDEPNLEYPKEAIKLTIENKDGSERKNLFCINCSMYIMNDAGNTIDAVHCG